MVLKFKKKRGLRSYGILRNVDWWLVTAVSRQPTNPVLKGQAVLALIDP